MRKRFDHRRCALFVAVAAVGLASCARVARPDALPPEVFAGEPVRLGADGAAWSYGDGTSGSSGVHAFARAGTYAVSVNGGREGFSVRVLPRPVLRAIPADATWAVWIPSPKESSRAIVDFCEHAAGGVFTADGTDRDPFLRYLQELAAQPAAEELALDPAEGIASFSIPAEVPVRITAVGVVDEARAVQGAAAMFSEAGFSAVDLGERIVLRHPQGAQLQVFADRGYLYLVSLDEDAGDGAEAASGAIVKHLREANAPGGDATADAPGARAGAGDAFVMLRSVRAGEFELSRVIAALSFEDEQLHVTAALEAAAPLWDVARAPELNERLFEAADGAQFFALASADPRGLGRIVDALIALRPAHGLRPDLDRGGVPKATAVVGGQAVLGLRGDASFVGKIDVERTLARLSARGAMPDFEGKWWLLATANDCNRAGGFLETLFEELFVMPTRQRSSDALIYDVELGDGRTATAGCTPRESTLWFSTEKHGAAADPNALRAKFGADAFSRGHLSVLVDLGALVSELEMPAQSESARTMQGFASTFLQQLTGIDTVFLDVVPDATGAKARAEVRLRTR